MKMRRTKKEFKYFTIPQYEKEQEYLNEMHRHGWKLKHITFPGIYHFEECEPEDVVYQLDYNQDGIENKEEYTQLFADCGWEYLFDFVGYSYFRKSREAGEVDTSIFCDDASRLDMMKRVFKGRMTPLLIVFFAIILPQLFMQMNRHDLRLGSFLVILYLILFFVYIFSFLLFGIQFYQYELKVLNEPGKTKKKFIGLVLGLTALTTVVSVGAYFHFEAQKSDYKFTDRSNGYGIEAEYFTDQISLEYDLEVGDEIFVETEPKSGTFSIVMGCEGKEPIFTGTGQFEDGFSVTVNEAGRYKISCKGNRAKGNINFIIK